MEGILAMQLIRRGTSRGWLLVCAAFFAVVSISPLAQGLSGSTLGCGCGFSQLVPVGPFEHWFQLGAMRS
jgi:hypothetical protein